MRPIMLTAAAASLALIPIAREIFWGPMAYAMMGGIIVGTVLTLLFLPALYVAWFRIKEPEPTTDSTHENPLAPEMQAVSSADHAPSGRNQPLRQMVEIPPLPRQPVDADDRPLVVERSPVGIRDVMKA
jgi:hypothetical protein